jgi:hypothetical protein
VSNAIFSKEERDGLTILGKLPSIELPEPADTWFITHSAEKIDVVKDYLIGIIKGKLSTAHFLSSSESDLPTSVEKSSIGHKSPFPRPE